MAIDGQARGYGITRKNSFAPSPQATEKFKSTAAQKGYMLTETTLRSVRYLFYAYRNRSGVIVAQIKKEMCSSK
jgi:hypothetical protein